MKKNYFIVFISLSIGFVFSCKEKQSPIVPLQTTVKSVDSTNLIVSKSKPKLEFEYKLLDSGKVYLNYSKLDTIVWYGDWMVSNEKETTFKFEANGFYLISLRVRRNNEFFSDSTFQISITNAKKEAEKSTLNGIIFDKKINFEKNALPSNYLFGIPLMSFPKNKIATLYNLNEKGQTIFIGNFLDINGIDYQTMKKIFKVGKQPLAQFEGNPVPDFNLNKNGWFVSIWGENGIYNFGNNPEDFVEILAVQEVTQPKLFPAIEEKAFWVTWHIKADTNDRGKIDFILKIKYIVYGEFLGF